jgi:hypothetical protein
MDYKEIKELYKNFTSAGLKDEIKTHTKRLIEAHKELDHLERLLKKKLIEESEKNDLKWKKKHIQEKMQ